MDHLECGFPEIGKMFRRILSIRNYRELIVNFVLRDVKEKYRGTLLGYLWTLLTPLLITFVFVIVFTYVVPVRIPRYPVYLLTGLLVWNNFYASLSDCAWSIRRGGDLLKKVYFPPEVFPVSAVIANLVTLCLSLLVLIPLLIAYNIQPTQKLCFLPGIILWQALFGYGLGMILALSHVYFRDTGPLLDMVLSLWFYATPVIFSLNILPTNYLFLFRLNPIVYPFEMIRSSLISTPLPEVNVLIFNLLISFFIILLGILVFRKENKYFSDWL